MRDRDDKRIPPAFRGISGHYPGQFAGDHQLPTPTEPEQMQASGGRTKQQGDGATNLSPYAGTVRGSEEGAAKPLSSVKGGVPRKFSGI